MRNTMNHQPAKVRGRHNLRLALEGRRERKVEASREGRTVPFQFSFDFLQSLSSFLFPSTVQYFVYASIPKFSRSSP